MQLPDFLQFTAFNKLRESMGAEELGSFEFFDPKKHLTGQERAVLAGGAVEVRLMKVRRLMDFTLAYKNSRVFLFYANPQSAKQWLYHIADCERLLVLRDDVDLKLQATTAEPQSDSGCYSVCGECLQRMQYKGFDAMRSRHREYSERIRKEFDLHEFQREYPAYPIKEEKQVSF